MRHKFEDLLSAITELPLGGSDTDRNVHWFDEAGRVGVARQAGGQFEIFIVGEEIVARSLLVRRHLKCDSWTGQSGLSFIANRVVLPAEQHFLASTAFLVEELLRNDVLVTPQMAFRKCEPIFELFLRRSALDEQVVQGLVAELLVLEVGLQVASSISSTMNMIESWKGWSGSSRDFQFGSSSIEVKSTAGFSSRHSVGCLDQVNGRSNVDGAGLENLYLVSFGLHAGDGEVGRSLPELIDDIVARIEHLLGPCDGLIDELLDRIARYGAVDAVGYIHREMRGWSVYAQPYSRTFLRIYDMCDPLVRVLRFEDVAERIHTKVDSISFEIDLPPNIDGEINPSSDLRGLLRKLV